VAHCNRTGSMAEFSAAICDRAVSGPGPVGMDATVEQRLPAVRIRAVPALVARDEASRGTHYTRAARRLLGEVERGASYAIQSAVGLALVSGGPAPPGISSNRAHTKERRLVAAVVLHPDRPRGTGICSRRTMFRYVVRKELARRPSQRDLVDGSLDRKTRTPVRPPRDRGPPTASVGRYRTAARTGLIGNV